MTHCWKQVFHGTPVACLLLDVKLSVASKKQPSLEVSLKPKFLTVWCVKVPCMRPESSFQRQKRPLRTDGYFQKCSGASRISREPHMVHTRGLVGSSLGLGLKTELQLLDFCQCLLDTLCHYPPPTARYDFALDLGILIRKLNFFKKNTHFRSYS